MKDYRAQRRDPELRTSTFYVFERWRPVHIKYLRADLEGAKEYFEWALRIFRDKLDGDHPTTKIILINLYLFDPS
jgi:hypothetical protein